MSVYESDANNDEMVRSRDVVKKAPQIIPSITGVITGEIFLDALTTAQITGIKVTPNPGDSVTAATRLANGQPDVISIAPNESKQISSSAPITNLTIAMVANIAVTEAAYNAATKVATGTINTSLVAADFQTVQVEFDFSAADFVTMAEIELITYSDGTTDDNLGVLKVTGYAL